MSFRSEMLRTLRGGGSVKVVRSEENGPRKGLAAEQRKTLDELVSEGHARKSLTGRYWGTGR